LQISGIFVIAQIEKQPSISNSFVESNSGRFVTPPWKIPSRVMFFEVYTTVPRALAPTKSEFYTYTLLD